MNERAMESSSAEVNLSESHTQSPNEHSYTE